MDPRERADAALARARARGAFVVTPEDAVSPMDASSTLQIPRSVVTAADRDPEPAESTMVISAGLASGQAAPTQPLPTQQPQPAQRPMPRPQQQRPQQPQQQRQPAPQQQAARPPDEPPPPQQLDGLVPTVHQPGTSRGTLSRRLDGQ